jgi:RNA polymerase sigma-70 factor (ECF subfamily)
VLHHPAGAESLSELYRRHGAMVFRRARQILGTEEEALEAMQDLFLSLHEKPDQFAGNSSVTTFLYSATTHACLNRLRNERNRARLQCEQVDRLEELHGEGMALSPEQRSMLRSTLSRMPEELASACVYYFVDGLSHDEIARLMGCSRRHVGNLLVRVPGWAASEENQAC